MPYHDPVPIKVFSVFGLRSRHDRLSDFAYDRLRIVDLFLK
jgi:hypothetical protein